MLEVELSIALLDTGSPIYLGRAREVLGEDVLIRGGVWAYNARAGPKGKIEEEVKTVRLEQCCAPELQGGSSYLGKSTTLRPAPR